MKWSLLNRYYNISFKKNTVFFVAKYVLECVSLIWHHDLFDAVSSTAWTQWPWQCQRISSRDVYGDHQKSYQEIIDPCLSIESSTITTCHKEPWKLFLEIVSCRNSTYQSSEPRNWSRLVAKKQFDSMASCDHVWCLCLLHLYIYIYTCRNFHVHKIYDHGHPWTPIIVWSHDNDHVAQIQLLLANFFLINHQS